MMRICAIGDSHLAALKAGWMSIENEFPNVELDFFGAPGLHITDIVVSEGRLLSSTDLVRHYLETTSGGSSEIKNCYDQYFVCGLGLSVFSTMRVYNKHRAENHVQQSCTPVSDDCFLQAVTGCLRETLSVETLKKLREITDAPIGLIAAPLPGKKNRKAKLYQLSTSEDTDSIAAFFTMACEQIATEQNARFLPQPSRTIGNSAITTKQVYALAPARFFVNGAVDDGNHMSADFGAVVLRHALIKMDSAPTKSGLASGTQQQFSSTAV